MNDKEKLLIAEFLEMAYDEFSNHGCNDLDFDLIKNWTPEELKNLNFEMHKQNNDIEEEYEYLNYANDSILMSFFADKLRKEVENG